MGSTPGGGPCQNSCGPPLPDTSKRSVAVRFEVFVRSRRPRTRRRWTAATSTGCVVAAAGALVLVHPQQEQQPASAPELSLMNAHQLVSDEVADVASGDQSVADSTHIRRELLQLAVTNAQAMITDNGVAALTGVGREVGTCVAQWSLATLGAPNADAQALAQCLSPLANLDPSETTEAMRALHFGDIIATLTAAGTPHSPTIVHTLTSSFAPAPAPAPASPTHTGQPSATAPATPGLPPPRHRQPPHRPSNRRHLSDPRPPYPAPHRQLRRRPSRRPRHHCLRTPPARRHQSKLQLRFRPSAGSTSRRPRGQSLPRSVTAATTKASTSPTRQEHPSLPSPTGWSSARARHRDSGCGFASSTTTGPSLPTDTTTKTPSRWDNSSPPARRSPPSVTADNPQDPTCTSRCRTPQDRTWTQWRGSPSVTHQSCENNALP